MFIYDWIIQKGLKVFDSMRGAIHCLALLAVLGWGSMAGQPAFAQDPGSRTEPDLVYDKTRNCFYGVFELWDASGWEQIYGQAFNEGGAAEGAQYVVRDDPSSGATQPAIGFDPVNNGLLVLWQQNPGGGTSIHGRLASYKGTLSGSEITLQNDSEFKTAPEVSANTVSGGYLAVWDSQNIGNINVLGMTVANDGTLGSLINIDNTAGTIERDPEVAFDPGNDRFLVVYSDQETTNQVSSVFVSAAGVAGSKLLVAATTNIPTGTDVAFDSVNNQYLVIWEDGGAISGQILDVNAVPSGGIIQVSDGSAISAANPAVAFDPANGNYLVVWEDSRNTNVDIYGQKIDSTGTLVGGNTPEFSGAGNQTEPAVIANGTNGGFLVQGTDESSGTIFERLSTFVTGTASASGDTPFPPASAPAVFTAMALLLLLSMGLGKMAHIGLPRRIITLTLLVGLLVAGGVVSCSSGDGDGGVVTPPAACQ